jgi:hypothetical protein
MSTALYNGARKSSSGVSSSCAESYSKYASKEIKNSFQRPLTFTYIATGHSKRLLPKLTVKY